jgi:hypothetical protein
LLYLSWKEESGIGSLPQPIVGQEQPIFALLTIGSHLRSDRLPYAFRSTGEYTAQTESHENDRHFFR